MKLSFIEMKKALLSYWEHMGYNPLKIKDNQVYVLYMKYEREIDGYVRVKKSFTAKDEVCCTTERDMWSDDEWNDYAFEEADME